MLVLEAMPELGTSPSKSSVGTSALDKEDFKLWVTLVSLITVESWLAILYGFASEFWLYVAIVEVVDEITGELSTNHYHFFQYDKHEYDYKYG